MWTRLFSRTKRPPSLPAGVRIYAVGDVHGRADLLNDVLTHIDLDLAQHPVSRPLLVFLGDYIDRGPASREVLDRLAGVGLLHEVVFLKGNHEIFPTAFLEDPSVLDRWREFGGLETLVSYGLRPSVRPTCDEQIELARGFARALPSSHRQFLGKLKPYFSCGDFFFAHAGIRPGVPLDRQREEDLLWIRDEFLSCDDEYGKIIVHGHEPVRDPDIRSNRINIDTGAFATGRLCCLIIEGTTIVPTTDRDDWRDRIYRTRTSQDLQAGINVTNALGHDAIGLEYGTITPGAVQAEGFRRGLSWIAGHLVTFVIAGVTAAIVALLFEASQLHRMDAKDAAAANALRIARGEELLAAGDVQAARSLLLRAAEAGDARAALAVGATYDPAVLWKLRVPGIVADIAAARMWYQQAKGLGSAEAQQRIDALNAWVQSQSTR